MNRDWQDDKTNNLLKRCEIAKSYNETISVWPNAIIELINKATAEKARADQAEAREQKLKEALERILKTTKEEAASKYYTNTIILRKAIILRQKVIENLFSALYPKEETE